jgi:hypothetical protein
MHNSSERTRPPRPAFHFEPLTRLFDAAIRFLVVVTLPNGAEVTIGSTRTREDAIALTRLVKISNGIEVKIVDVDEEFRLQRLQRGRTS